MYPGVPEVSIVEDLCLSTLWLFGTIKRQLFPMKNMLYQVKEHGVFYQLGTDYGGFYFPWKITFPKKSVMLSFGCGEDISFDIAMAKMHRMTVHLFDPTPRASIHVEAVFDAIRSKKTPELVPSIPNSYIYNGKERTISYSSAKEYFDTIRKSSIKPSQLTHHPWALSHEDGEFNFFPPAKDEWVSHYLNGSRTDEALSSPFTGVNEKVKTVTAHRYETILKLSRLHKVEALKLDIEGAEIAVIPDLIESFNGLYDSRELWPRVIFIDMDSLLPYHPRFSSSEARSAMRVLHGAGYEMMPYIGPGPVDFTFVLRTAQA